MLRHLKSIFGSKGKTVKHRQLTKTARLGLETLEERCLMSNLPLDTSFSSDGMNTTSFDLGGGDKDVAARVAVQADGKIVVVGSVQRNDSGDFDFAVARYNTNGSLDTSFSGDGKAQISFDIGGNLEDRATGVAIQSDGKIVISGYVQINGFGDFDFGVVRLTSSGSLDTSFSGDGKQTIFFDNGGSNDDRAMDVAIQSDGKIVVVGYTEFGWGDTDFAVARLNSSGSLDSSFSLDGKLGVAFDLGGVNDDRATSVALTSDNKIVVAGYVQRNLTGDYDFGVARINSTGGLESSFSSDGKATVSFDRGGVLDDRAADVAVQADGKIVLVGYSQADYTGGHDFAVARLTTGGNLDGTFSGDGKEIVRFDRGGFGDDRATGVAIQGDGKIVVAGYVQRDAFGDYDFAFQRLNADGTADFSIGDGGKAITSFNKGGNKDDRAAGVAIAPDGKIIVAGSARFGGSQDYDFAVARYNPNRGQAAWTVFVYMTASDLTGFIHEDVNELEMAVSLLPANVNVVVFWDQSNAGTKYATGNGNIAWGSAGRAVLSGDADMGRVVSTFDVIGERNSGDPATLTEFLLWGESMAPADRYALIVGSHGAGLLGSSFDDKDGVTSDRLDVWEMISGLSGASSDVSIDVLAYDACLMGMAEIGYELRNLTDVFVASEEITSGKAQNYILSLGALMVNPAAVTPVQLGSAWVETWEDLYAGTLYPDTYSATNTKAYNLLASRLLDFVDATDDATDSDWGDLRFARNNSITFDCKLVGSAFDYDYRDLGDFMDRVADDTTITQAIRTAAGAVRDFLAEGGSLVINRTADDRGSSGVAIYLPTTDMTSWYGTTYNVQNGMTVTTVSFFSNFTSATRWDDFLVNMGSSGPGSPAVVSAAGTGRATGRSMEGNVAQPAAIARVHTLAGPALDESMFMTFPRNETRVENAFLQNPSHHRPTLNLPAVSIGSRELETCLDAVFAGSEWHPETPTSAAWDMAWESEEVLSRLFE